MDRSLPLVALFFGMCLWIYALGWSLSGYPIYRAQHLGAALHYATDGIDLLRPIIPGFNATGTGTPQELPLWQACAAWALRLGNGWWGAANIISLLLFFSFLPFFWRTAREEADAQTAWLALILLFTQPLVFHLAGGAQTDGFSLALLLFFVWSFENFSQQKSMRALLFCALGAALLAVTKFPFLLAGGFAATLRMFFSRDWSFAKWLALSFVGLTALLSFWTWNHWCEQEIGRALFRYRPLTFREIPDWFLGAWDYRLDPVNYLKAGWRALACLWGSFVMVGFTIYGLWKSPRSLGACLLYGAILTTLIFTKLVLIHRHYYLIFAPAVALLNASAISACFVNSKKWFSACLAPLLLLSLAQGLISIEVVSTGDPYLRRIGTVVAAKTQLHEKLLVVGGGWGGDIFLFSQRAGLSVDDSKLAENPDTLRQLQALGYTKIAWISESPLLHALQVTNPGESSRLRDHFPVQLPARLSIWPTVYQSDELVIKELPLP